MGILNNACIAIREQTGTTYERLQTVIHKCGYSSDVINMMGGKIIANIRLTSPK